MHKSWTLPSSNVHEHLLDEVEGVLQFLWVVNVQRVQQAEEHRNSPWNVLKITQDDWFLEYNRHIKDLVSIFDHGQADFHNFAEGLLLISGL